jgi:hypothetical protein
MSRSRIRHEAAQDEPEPYQQFWIGILLILLQVMNKGCRWTNHHRIKIARGLSHYYLAGSLVTDTDLGQTLPAQPGYGKLLMYSYISTCHQSYIIAFGAPSPMTLPVL